MRGSYPVTTALLDRTHEELRRYDREFEEERDRVLRLKLRLVVWKKKNLYTTERY